MLLTEAEAKTKWCPQIRYGNEPGCNRNWTPEGAEMLVCCIASECMMWRWAAYTIVHGLGAPKEERAEGFCGLAVHPCKG